MALPKYKKQYQEMMKTNVKLFESLKNTDRNSEEFKSIQRQVIRIVRQYEDALCAKTENTRYLNFSSGLADKFMEEVRIFYPEIDYSS